MMLTDGKRLYRSQLEYVIEKAEERTLPFVSEANPLGLNLFYIFGEQICGRIFNYMKAWEQSKNLRTISDQALATLLAEYVRPSPKPQSH